LQHFDFKYQQMQIKRKTDSFTLGFVSQNPCQIPTDSATIGVPFSAAEDGEKQWHQLDISGGKFCGAAAIHRCKD